MINYYELLKLPEAITHEEIEFAFNNFKNELLKFSPGIKLSETELRSRKPDIWNAYEFLLNSTFRKEYDEALERDRIHQLYEAQNRIEEEQEQRSSEKRRYIGLVAVILIVIIYFVMGQVSSNNLPEQPNWRTHNITDEIKVFLPAPVDSCTNILPGHLLDRSLKKMCYISELAGGFSVTVAKCELNGPFAISFSDVAYAGSREMQNLHLRFKKQDTSKVNITIHNYMTRLTKGTYQIDDVIRGYDNYDLINGNRVIKIVVNYVPGKEEHEKYAEIILKSLMQ